jgi:hypothetical protein
MSGKQFAHSQATNSVKDALSARFRTDTPQPKPAAAEPPGEAAPMVNRSWYLPREVADELTAAADELRYTVPALSKADALAALIRAGVAHQDEIREQLLADDPRRRLSRKPSQ